MPYEDIVKGYEVEKGRYVIVTPEELEASLAVARKGRAADVQPASGGGDVGGQHRDWTRERLHDEAQRRGIPGRSSMNKDELIEALAEAS